MSCFNKPIWKSALHSETFMIPRTRYTQEDYLFSYKKRFLEVFSLYAIIISEYNEKYK